MEANRILPSTAKISRLANIRDEFNRLALSLGVEPKTKGALWYLTEGTLMEGELNGLSFQVTFMRHVTGSRSVPVISLIVNSPNPCKHRFKMQNTAGVWVAFYTNNEATSSTPATTLTEEQVREVMPGELLDFLQATKVSYIFSVLDDRVIISTYDVYQHPFYVFLLEKLTEVAANLQSKIL